MKVRSLSFTWLTVLFVLLLSLSACGEAEDDTAAVEELGGEGSVPVAEITEDVEGYYGSAVAVVGEVVEVVAPNAFVMGDSEAAEATPILVISAVPFPVMDEETGEDPFELEDAVLVEGAIEEFDLATFEAELEVDLDDEVFGAFEGAPAIVPSEVRQPTILPEEE